MTLVAVSFSQSSPNSYTSLAPTFITYMNMLTGATFAPPGISQLAFTGIYVFYHSTTTPFYFLLDAITTSASTDRYVFGVLGSIQQVDIQLSQLSSTLSSYNSTAAASSVSLTAQSSTLFALGTSTYAIAETLLSFNSGNVSMISDISDRIGTTASTFGTTSIDPGTLYGYLKRNQEFLEGDQTFNKVSGNWDIMTRGGTLLVQKALSQTATNVSKS